MNQIFITGICGFLGSNLAYYFLSQGYRVYGVDNLSRKGSKKNYKLLKKNSVKIFKKDLMKLNNFNFLKKKGSFSAFIHCAALTSVLDGTNQNTTRFIYKNNFLSTLNSLELCKFLNTKFIYISSSRVYNITALNNIKLKIKENSFALKKNKLIGLTSKGINENFSTNSPLSFYGSTKLISENLVQEYCKHNKIPYLINRCGLLAGSGQLYKDDQGIISYWINSWKNKKKLNYIGFGSKGFQVRDCLHPLDLGNLIKKQMYFIKNKNLKTFIFNVSGGISSSFSLKHLSSWCKKNISFRKVGRAKRFRLFDARWLVLDNSKVKRIFNWKTKFSKYKIFQEIKQNDS